MLTTFERLKKHHQSFDLTARKQALLGFAKSLESRQEELAQALCQEVGKPIKQARAEIADTIKRTAFFVEHADQVSATKIILDKIGLNESISFEPLGLILCISAWNYPYFVSTNIILPALLAGCRVIFKPSELAPRAGQYLAQLLVEQPAFKDAFALVLGGKDTGADLVKLAFDGVFFTGSEQAGLAIKKSLGNRMIVSQFELGGKDAAYVCEDCDLEKTVTSLVDGSFYNTGQGCCSIERIYLHELIAERFTELFVAQVKKLCVGKPEDEETYIGPLTRGREQVDFLLAQVKDAESKGGLIACGGHALPQANYFAQTVITQANQSMLLMQEESFGPIVGIEIVSNDQEAISKINNSRFGLTGAVYSRNQNRAEQILTELEVGSAYWNCCDRVSSGLPWSGRKNSGLGLTLSTLGMAMFYRPKAWHKKP